VYPKPALSEPHQPPRVYPSKSRVESSSRVRAAFFRCPCQRVSGHGRMHGTVVVLSPAVYSVCHSFGRRVALASRQCSVDTAIHPCASCNEVTRHGINLHSRARSRTVCHARCAHWRVACTCPVLSFRLDLRRLRSHTWNRNAARTRGKRRGNAVQARWLLPRVNGTKKRGNKNVQKSGLLLDRHVYCY